MFRYHLRGALTAALIVLTTGIASLLPSSAVARTHSRHVTHHPSHSGIPQHGGGDHDADNFGGPSDGDGNV
jgi:hypothetical protein